jgi:hypothetical protein
MGVLDVYHNSCTSLFLCFFYHVNIFSLPLLVAAAVLILAMRLASMRHSLASKIRNETGKVRIKKERVCYPLFSLFICVGHMRLLDFSFRGSDDSR